MDINGQKCSNKNVEYVLHDGSPLDRSRKSGGFVYSGMLQNGGDIDFKEKSHLAVKNFY